MRASSSLVMKGPLERTIFAQLMKGTGEERFVFRDGAEAKLIAALEKELGGRDAKRGVEHALRLAAAFDGTLASSSAASIIRRVLKSDPRAVKMIREGLLKGSSLDESRAFARREGRESAAMRAPRFGERAPKSTIPLRAILNTGNSCGARGKRQR